MIVEFSISIHDISYRDLDPIEIPHLGLPSDPNALRLWWINAWRRVHRDDAEHVELGGEG